MGWAGSHDPLADPALEAGGMVGAHADVLVHVEDHRLGPRDTVGLLHQRVHEGQLRVAGGEHRVGHAAGVDRCPDDRERLVGGRPGHARRTSAWTWHGRLVDGIRVPGLHAFSMPGAAAARLDRCATSRFPGPPTWRRRGRRCAATSRVTPVVATPQLGSVVSVKLETVQPTGSFKVRGGLAAVAATLRGGAGPGRRRLVGRQPRARTGVRGVQAGGEVTVVVPTGASAAKVAALQQFDVRLVLHGEGYRDAETHALELAECDGQPVRLALQRPRRHCRAGDAGARAGRAGARPRHRRRPLRRRGLARRRHPRPGGQRACASSAWSPRRHPP